MAANFGGISGGPADVDAQIPADDPIQQRQRLQERRYSGLEYRIVRGCGQQHADATHALLRARRDRPRRCAAESTEEIATPHSITSSARPNSGSGTVMP